MSAPERPGAPAADARNAAKPAARSRQDELDWQAAKAKRPDLMLLMIGTVIAVMVLVGIVRTHLEIPGPTAARGVEPAASANAAAARDPSPTANRAILARVFDSTLADLKQENAANPEARRQTVAYRSMLTHTIASAKLKLDIETFECGRSLCVGSLRGDAGAYDALFAAIVSAPPLPIHSVIDYSSEREREDGPHRFIFSVSQDIDEASALKRPAAKP
ncbi:hypothetical protein [Lysobacter sp. Root690]|uniref:hypothetical protein n=1 Tax=Lysobacter sp. Root690 TaxID=1736588 RepID=UPI0006F6A635|nr:hypothetical protein [Lysobacter sp. Root690]KRB06167.1 hypothetical protein ASD86_15430 [Lysobacter sp. Root690]